MTKLKNNGVKKIVLRQNMRKSIHESSKTIQELINLIPQIEKTIVVIVKCLSNGKKIVLFGNGGSAADAQHIAAEFIGRFKLERKSYPALALTTDTSCITALSNDYSFDIVFSRQCESLIEKGDIVIGISTSGNSTNVKKGLEMAKKKRRNNYRSIGIERRLYWQIGRHSHNSEFIFNPKNSRSA